MTTNIQVAAPLIPLCAYQHHAIQLPSRFNWFNWSRQTGKSFTMSLRRILRGMQRNRNQILMSGSGRQSRELMAKVVTHLKAIRASVDCTFDDVVESQFEGTKFNQFETRVRHRTGAFDFRVIALPANPETARGYTGDVFMDEFAMHQKSREIWGAMYPALLRGNGEADVCSTPKGRGNMFYRLKSNKVFNCQTLTIEDAIAQGLQIDLESLLAGMGDEDLVRQEFYCEFLDGAMVFLSHDQIAACEDAALDGEWNEAKAESCADEDLYLGYDVARRKHLAVLWIWGKPRGSDVLYTRGVIGMRNTSFKIQRETIGSVLRLPNAVKLCIDKTGMGEQLAEELVEQFGETQVAPVQFTQATKSMLAEKIKPKVEDVRLRIPSDPDIRNDFHSVRRDVLPSGTFRYGQAQETTEEDGGKGHADYFWAAALGVHAASGVTSDFDYAGARLATGEDNRLETGATNPFSAEAFP